MTHHELDLVGIPSTILAWLSVFEMVSMDPIVSVGVKLLSTVWLGMQIYGWIEKRIKDNKDASKQKSRKSSGL